MKTFETNVSPEVTNLHDAVVQIISVRIEVSSDGNEIISSVDLHDTVVQILFLKFSII
jgi:hypothetical protein